MSDEAEHPVRAVVKSQASLQIRRTDVADSTSISQEA